MCERLDGLPLAIELAAAQLGKMSMSDLVDYLQRRSDLVVVSRAVGGGHHRSLAAAIEWSYGRLRPAEQRVFDHVAVLPGGFGVAEAAASAAPTRTPCGICSASWLPSRFATSRRRCARHTLRHAEDRYATVVSSTSIDEANLRPSKAS